MKRSFTLMSAALVLLSGCGSHHPSNRYASTATSGTEGSGVLATEHRSVADVERGAKRTDGDRHIRLDQEFDGMVALGKARRVITGLAGLTSDATDAHADHPGEVEARPRGGRLELAAISVHETPPS